MGSQTLLSAITKWRAAICLGLGVSCAIAQQYPFLPIAGSPKGIKSLFQDSKGRLWIAGDQLASFDGTHFFFLRDYGFPSVPSYDIAEDPSGAIWIGAETGIYRFSKGRVEEIGKGVVPSILAPRTDLIVAAVGPLGRGIPRKPSLLKIHRDGPAWKSEIVMSLDSPGPISLDPFGTFLFPSALDQWLEFRLADLVRWRPGAKLAVSSHGRAGGDPINGMWSVNRDHAGCVWKSAPGATAYNCGEAEGKWHRAPVEGASTVAPVHEASDGRILLWGNNFVSIGRPGSWKTATVANGLPGIVTALPAKDGSIWLGTTQGLFRFASPFQIEYWTVREGLPNPPWSIARSGQRIYAGLENRVVVLSPDRQHWDTFARFDSGGDVSALLGQEDGTLLAARTNGGVNLLGPHGAVLSRLAPGHPATATERLSKGADGEIWLGGGELGLLKRVGPLLQYKGHPLEHKPSGNVLSIKYQEDTHKLWSCYSGGLVVRDEHGNWQEFQTTDGLLANGCWSLAPMPNGDTWYSYLQLRSLALIQPGAHGRIAVRQYGAGTGIEPGGDTLDADRSGRLWRGGDLGLYVADPAQAEAGNWLQFDQSDGFPANGMNSGSVFADPDGSMWWGSDNDLAHFTPPRNLTAPEFAPQVFVSAFSWENQPQKLAEAVSELPHTPLVTAHLGSLQFDRRNALRVRYRVLPEHRAWRESRSLEIPLGNIAYGPHTLEVQGRVFTGPWSQTLRRSFDVPRPIWLTSPALLWYLMATSLLLFTAYMLYRQRQADQAQMLPDLANWRVEALIPDAHQVMGTLLDSRFEVGELLARGGFANVLDGFDRHQRQRCAIKIFRNEITDKAWVQRSFDQEVAALQKVRHPNVVSIYAHGRIPAGAPYLVMEFVDGQNLREIVSTGGLPHERVARLLQQLAAALDAIHTQEICHRDLKPENVIVRNAGSPTEQSVLIDFSIAIIKDADETLHGLSRAAGTFDYMAPEQAIGYAQSSSDIYSLARLLIEMLTGRPLRQLLPGAALDLPTKARELVGFFVPALSNESLDMLASALEFDPAKRPSSASDFASPLVRDLRIKSSGESA